VGDIWRNQSVSVAEAFKHCESIARKHYENFPVASFFLPKQLRPYIAVIYAFARVADDFADEGRLSQSERLAALDHWQKQLDECYEGRADNPIFVALTSVVREKNIPKGLLSDLLAAFRMDVTTFRYRTYDDLLYYCRHSANPVGRLVLHIFDNVSEGNMHLSDSICTALQLANFWQDVSIDVRKGRLYIPLEDMDRFGYTESEFERPTFDERFRNLMKFEVERTRDLFGKGKPLLMLAPSNLRFELALTWHGGRRILQKIENAGYNVLTERPALNGADRIAILMKALMRRTA
jgi:squalene synthase HpnC